MTAPHLQHPSPSPSFDLSWRPASYVDFRDPISAIVSTIKGTRRREMVRDVLERRSEAGRSLAEVIEDGLAEGLLDESADESFVDFMSCYGDPTWMGGEFLPELRRNEVEIARLTLNSTTMDVTSYRARWSGDRYHYSARDEYGNRIVLSRRTSVRPLTLGEMVDLVGESWCPDFDEGFQYFFPDVFWEASLESMGDVEQAMRFAWVSSDIYPQLGEIFDARAVEWAREMREKREMREMGEEPAGGVRGHPEG